MKYLKKLWIVVFVMFGISAFSQSNTEKYKAAEELIDSSQFEEAISILNTLIVAEPNNFDYQQSLAYSFLNLSDYESAINCYNIATKINPNCIKCYSHCARAWFELGDLDKAWATVNQGFELSDTTAQLYMIRGLIYQARRDADHAMLDFTRAVHLENTNTDYLIARANFYIQTNQVHFAYSDLSDAIELEPKVPDYYYYRAYILMGLNVLDEALIDINKAIELDSTVADFYNLKFSIHFSRFEYGLAEKSVRKSLEIFPDSYMAYTNLGDLYFQINQFEDYCEAYQQALPLIPADQQETANVIRKTQLKYCNDSLMPYYFIRALKAYNNSEYLKVIEIADAGLQKIGKSSVLENLKASAYLALYDYNNAFDFFETSLQNKDLLKSEVIDFYSIKLTDEDIKSVANSYIVKSNFGLAMIHLKNHETEAAMQKAIKAAEMAETVPDFDGKEFVYNVKGLIYILQGDNQNALKQFNIAKEKNHFYQQSFNNEALLKVLGACKYKSSTFEFEYYEPVKSMRMKIPNLKLIKGSENKLQEALEICNTIIEKDNKNAYAYLIKAKILLLTNDDSYKQFVDKAVEYGISEAYKELGMKN
ncbi:MAG: tetratricopeptide repeat protein [Bacteroidales bacterium]|nr:tetratricopeptide repeat protein [Bacteroidales bacterium]